MFTLIKHAIQMRRVQSVATLASVAISCAVVFALACSYAGVQAGLDKSAKRMGADLMAIPADAAVGLDENSLLFTGVPANMYMSEDVVKRIRAIDGVERVSAQFYGQTLDKSCCSSEQPSRLIGFDFDTDWAIKPWLNVDIDGLSDGQIIAGATMAPDFVSGGTVLGHAVQLAASIEPTGTDIDGSVLMSIQQVRDYVKQTPELSYLWEQYGDPDTLVSCVLVDAEDGREDEVAAELSSLEGIAVVQGSAVVERMDTQLGSLFAIMAGAAALLVAATLFQLFARFFSLAWDRRSELALYRALGASRGEIAKLIVGEAAVLVGAGIVLGLALGAGLYALVPGLLAAGGSFPYVAPGIGLCVGLGAGVAVLFALLALAAVAWPLSRAGRIDPSSAMQTGDID